MLTQALKALGGFAIVMMAAVLGLTLAGYTIQVDLWDTPTLPPAVSTPAPAPSEPTRVSATSTPTDPPIIAPTATLEPPSPTPQALDTSGAPFRLLIDGAPVALAWEDVRDLVAPGATGRLAADQAAIHTFVAAFAADHRREAQRAAFHWDAATGQPEVAVESRPGQAVDEAALETALAAALETGQGGDLSVPMTSLVPEWTSDHLPTIGGAIVGEGRIYYADDDAATVQNVEQGALALDGAIALPGAVFSHDAWVYDGRAYAPSYTIIGDRTLLAPGGGLCIVATTLFQTVFWAGLPIVERHNHPYWITMYAMQVAGQTYKGLDATVGDVRFRNTTGAALRVHSWTADGWLHIQLIGTRPTWQVRVRDYAISNFRPALSTVSYYDEPNLPQGRQEVARNPHDGFDATITREVIQDGVVIDTYQAVSHYQVTEKQIMVGTGP